MSCIWSVYAAQVVIEILFVEDVTGHPDSFKMPGDVGHWSYGSRKTLWGSSSHESDDLDRGRFNVDRVSVCLTWKQGTEAGPQSKVRVWHEFQDEFCTQSLSTVHSWRGHPWPLQ